MNDFKKMKIAVTAEQPLDEIDKELTRLGYEKRCVTVGKPRFISTEINGFYDVFFIDYCDYRKTTTLTELKNMKCFEH